MVSLLTGQVSTEFGIRTPASKFFNVFAKQPDKLQKMAEKVHKSNQVPPEGSHGIGSVMTWTVTIDGELETLKKKIEAIDEGNMSITYNLYDGTEISQHYKTLKLSLQLIEKEDVGGVVKWTCDYEKINEDIAPPYRYLDHITEVIRDVDADLQNA